MHLDLPHEGVGPVADGAVVGAERPSVSHALARLSSADLVTRERNGLILHGTAAHHIACLVERADEGTAQA